MSEPLLQLDTHLYVQQRPDFLKLEEIEALLDQKTHKASALFAQQFCERLRKPELLARELAAHFSAFKP